MERDGEVMRVFIIGRSSSEQSCELSLEVRVPRLVEPSDEQ
jgi:hypothetical protein